MYKKLDPGSKANNGPVSVLPFIMESIWKKIYDQFHEYMEIFLGELLCGFRKHVQ